LDAHPSDGILDIKEKLSLDYLKVYSFGYCQIARSFPDLWLKETLRLKCFEFEGCDLVIYNAGVDSHIDDKLGGYLTTEQMTERDDTVFHIMKLLNIPVVVSLAGGYQRDDSGSIRPVLDLHDMTFKKAYEAEINSISMTSRTPNTISRNESTISQNKSE
jgi:acetoin utilization deacetylase AcuC-like enzyme